MPSLSCLLGFLALGQVVVGSPVSPARTTCSALYAVNGRGKQPCELKATHSGSILTTTVREVTTATALATSVTEKTIRIPPTEAPTVVETAIENDNDDSDDIAAISPSTESPTATAIEQEDDLVDSSTSCSGTTTTTITVDLPPFTSGTITTTVEGPISTSTVYAAVSSTSSSSSPSKSPSPTTGTVVNATISFKPPPMKIQVVDQPRLIHPGGIYIRANRLFNTTNQLIAGYATADDNSKALMASVSLDGGRSWSFRGEVTRVGNPWDHDLDNAFPLQLPSGRILFAFRNHDLHRGRYTWYRITVCASDDDGRTWKLQSHVEERKAAAGDHMRNGLWEPFMRVAADGAVVQLYYSASVTSRSQYNVMRYSRDGGRTWSGKKIDVSHGPDFWSNNWKDLSRDGMISIAPRTGKPGELIAIMESTMAETMTYSITTIESDDDGWKWRHNTSDRSLIYAAHAKKNAGAPGIINVGGTLVASFMTNEAERTPGIDGGELKFIVSVDGGKTWSSNGAAKSQDWGAAFTVAGGGVHWPGLCALNGTHFLALYSRDGLGAVSQMCRVVPVKKKELPGGVS